MKTYLKLTVEELEIIHQALTVRATKPKNLIGKNSMLARQAGAAAKLLGRWDQEIRGKPTEPMSLIGDSPEEEEELDNLSREEIEEEYDLDEDEP